MVGFGHACGFKIQMGLSEQWDTISSRTVLVNRFVLFRGTSALQKEVENGRQSPESLRIIPPNNLLHDALFRSMGRNHSSVWLENILDPV